jgi:hypothetical protein
VPISRQTAVGILIENEDCKDMMTKKQSMSSANISLLVVDAEPNINACAWEALADSQRGSDVSTVA